MTRLGRTDVEDRHPEDWEALDHQVIVALLEGLHREHDPAALRRRLLSLRPVLDEHFKCEESPGGLFDEIVRQDPGRTQEVSALRAEHAEILAELRGVVEEIDTLQAALEQLHEVKERLVQRLHAHHHAEERLLLDVVLRDEGRAAD